MSTNSQSQLSSGRRGDSFPLISFILPVYNVEKYLDNCLLSIEDQGLEKDEYEVILVDDGSTDRSLAICKEWEKTRTNYHVLNQKNQGAGFARNAGLKIASGRYILFMDSDDLLVPHSIKPLTESLDGRYDMVLATRIWVNDDLFPEIPEVSDDCAVFDGFGIDYLKQFPPLIYCTNSLFRRSFLTEKGIQFSNLAPSEDRLFMFHVLSANPRLVQYDRPIYYYMIRSDSITRIRNREKLATLAKNQVEVFSRIVKSMSTMDSDIKARGIASIQYNLIWVYERLFLSDISLKGFKAIVDQLSSIEALPVTSKGEWPFMINLSSTCLPTLYMFKAIFSMKSWFMAKWVNSRIYHPMKGGRIVSSA